MIKGINALVDAKRALSFNNAIKLINENVQITHDRLITLENRTTMMAKAIIPVLKDFKQDVLLIVAMIAFLLKYQKTMQAMLAAILQTNTKNNAIQSVQVDQIGRTYPPLFTINLPKEEENIDDLREITTMEYVVKFIMIIVCIAIVLIIMYFCCMKCRHTHTIFKYCFPF